MRIAIVVERFDGGGGCERSTAQIAAELVSRGHCVTVITGYCPENGGLPGVEVRRFMSPLIFRPLHWIGFVRWARRELSRDRGRGGFDVTLSMTMAIPGDVVQPRGGTIRETLERNVQMRSGTWSRFSKRVLLKISLKQQISLRLESKTAKDPSVRRILAVSGYVARQLRQHYRVDDSRITIIPNAAEMPEVTPEQQQRWRGMIREGFGVPEDAVMFLFSAMNPRLKGVDTLLDATKQLVDSGHNPVVMLSGRIGYGYQKRVADMGVRDHVRIVGTTDQMPRLYAAADVTVLPTYYDPSSKVVIESLMMGTPAISTSFNGASDLLGSENGTPARGRVITDPGDVNALAAAMTELMDPVRRRACVEAIGGLRDSLSMRRHVDRLEAVLEEVSESDRVGHETVS